MSKPMPADIIPTQADRDAAADWLAEDGLDWGYCGDVREGRADHALVQAFARHAAAARAEGREEAARVADAFAGNASHPCMSVIAQLSTAIRAKGKL